jgi:hypothetical protein
MQPAGTARTAAQHSARTAGVRTRAAHQAASHRSNSKHESVKTDRLRSKEKELLLYFLGISKELLG